LHSGVSTAFCGSMFLRKLYILSLSRDFMFDFYSIKSLQSVTIPSIPPLTTSPNFELQ
jgi:hypothetical protein